MTIRKTLAILLSLSALAYVGLAFADDGENGGGQKNNSEQKREQRKSEWEQEREQLKTERQQTLENLKQKKEQLRSEFKVKMAEDRCTKIEARIQNQAGKLGSVEVKHMSAYTNLQNRIEKFIVRFEAFYDANPDKGDKAKLDGLKADLGFSTDDTDKTLNGLINIFKQSLTNLSANLGASKKTTCGSSEGDFRATLADAKVSLQAVHDNAAAIRSFVRGTILPDLLAVKQDIAKIRGESDDENKTEDESDQDKSNDEGDENETSDTTAPTVSITAPADNSTYTAAATVAIDASATDNVKVEKVEFYDGGSLKGTVEDAPYSYSWSFTGVDIGTHIWTAVAYDDEDNSATSTPVSVTVTIP